MVKSLETFREWIRSFSLHIDQQLLVLGTEKIVDCLAEIGLVPLFALDELFEATELLQVVDDCLSSLGEGGRMMDSFAVLE